MESAKLPEVYTLDATEIFEITQKLAQASSSRVLWTSLFEEFSRLFQAKTMVYYHIPPFGGDEQDAPHSYVQQEPGEPPNDVKTIEYAFKNLVLNDPEALTDEAFWHESCVLPLINKDYSEVNDNGRMRGITIPAYGPACRNGAIVLAFRRGRQHLNKTLTGMATLFAQRAHEAYCKMIKSNLKQVSHMTPRETQILKELAQGHSNKAIARNLEISPHTVNGYLRMIMLKLGTEDRTASLLRAIRLGLISP